IFPWNKMKITTLGILGGGQLGRMSALAAARLGINVVIYCRHPDSPAAQIAHEAIFADYDDRTALRKFSNKVDVISYEFENIPLETINYLNNLKPDSVRPGHKLLEISQNRAHEKKFLNDIGIQTALWEKVENIDDIKKTIKKLKIN